MWCMSTTIVYATAHGRRDTLTTTHGAKAVVVSPANGAAARGFADCWHQQASAKLKCSRLSMQIQRRWAGQSSSALGRPGVRIFRYWARCGAAFVKLCACDDGPSEHQSSLLMKLSKRVRGNKRELTPQTPGGHRIPGRSAVSPSEGGTDSTQSATRQRRLATLGARCRRAGIPAKGKSPG